MSTQVTTKKVETLDDEADDDTDGEPTPLFDLGRNKKTKTVVRIAIKRTDPDEGHLGYLGPEASEHEIAHKWGGGEFVAQGKNAAGQIVVTQTIKIAGDPVFKSEIEEARWRRLNNLKPSKRRDDDAGGGGSLKDVLTLIEERDEKRRLEERDRREAERKENLDREERNRKEQRDHEEKLARETLERDERRRKDDEERAERQRQQHREDLERAEAANRAQLAQTQQFFTQLQAVNAREDKAAGASDPVKLLTAGMELALKMRGEGGGDAPPADALTALLSRLPETLAEVRSTAKEAYHEIKGKKIAAVPAEATGGPDEVTITGATALKMKRMIAVLQKAGKDPEAIIDGFASRVIGMANGGEAKAAPSARAPAAAAARTAGTPKKERAAPRRPPAAGKAKKAARRQTKKAST